MINKMLLIGSYMDRESLLEAQDSMRNVLHTYPDFGVNFIPHENIMMILDAYMNGNTYDTTRYKAYTPVRTKDAGKRIRPLFSGGFINLMVDYNYKHVYNGDISKCSTIDDANLTDEDLLEYVNVHFYTPHKFLPKNETPYNLASVLCVAKALRDSNYAMVMVSNEVGRVGKRYDISDVYRDDKIALTMMESDENWKPINWITNKLVVYEKGSDERDDQELLPPTP